MSNNVYEPVQIETLQWPWRFSKNDEIPWFAFTTFTLTCRDTRLSTLAHSPTVRPFSLKLPAPRLRAWYIFSSALYGIWTHLKVLSTIPIRRDLSKYCENSYSWLPILPLFLVLKNSSTFAAHRLPSCTLLSENGAKPFLARQGHRNVPTVDIL